MLKQCTPIQMPQLANSVIHYALAHKANAVNLLQLIMTVDSTNKVLDLTSLYQSILISPVHFKLIFSSVYLETLQSLFLTINIPYS